jgi:hypothetical protein
LTGRSVPVYRKRIRRNTWIASAGRSLVLYLR